MQKIKVVFDANIWVTYFIKNRTKELTDLIVDNNLIVCRSAALTDELNEVLFRPKITKRSDVSPTDYMLQYQWLTTFVPTTSEFEGCPDKDDNFLFDLAYQSSALYLVSGDKKVLSTPVKPPLQVITLADFKKIFS